MIHHAVFSPSSIVVVGASDDISKVGGRILKNILESSFSGPLYGINPKAEEVQGVPCPPLEDLPEIELAILAVHARFIPSYMQKLAEQKQTKGFIVLSAGFSEMGEEGTQLQDEIVAIARSCGGTVIGPNCTGVLTEDYAGVFAGPVPELSKEGCDLASGSGATAAFILEQGISAGLRFRQMISVGNSAQVGVEDVLAYWDETFDPENSAKIKLLYLESIANPRRLLKHSRSLREKGCRICAVKSGRSQEGRRAASSHTGAMASDDSFVDALFRKAGIIRCSGREDLVQAGILCSFPDMRKPSMAIVTHAGGPGVMLTDMLSEQGIAVPKLEGEEMDALLSRLHHGSSAANPIDFLATGTAGHLDDILTTLCSTRDDLGGITVIFGSPGLHDVSDVLDVLAGHIKNSSLPIYPVLPSIITAKDEIRRFTASGIPFFTDEVSFARTLGTAVRTGSSLPAVPMHPEPPALSYADQLTPDAQGYLPPQQASALLDAAGIPRIREAMISHPGELKELSLSLPWAMKVIGPVHKTDVGGVRLDISSLEEAEQTAEELLRIPEAKGVLIQEMASGTEFFCGVMRDDAFGHLLMTGLGGIFVETLKDTSSELLPIDRSTAEAMLASLKSYPVLTGTRGNQALAVGELTDLLLGVDALIRMVPEIAEMDINPVLVSRERAVSVDVRIRLRAYSV